MWLWVHAALQWPRWDLNSVPPEILLSSWISVASPTPVPWTGAPHKKSWDFDQLMMPWRERRRPAVVDMPYTVPQHATLTRMILKYGQGENPYYMSRGSRVSPGRPITKSSWGLIPYMDFWISWPTCALVCVCVLMSIWIINWSWVLLSYLSTSLDKSNVIPNILTTVNYCIAVECWICEIGFFIFVLPSYMAFFWHREIYWL